MRRSISSFLLLLLLPAVALGCSSSSSPPTTDASSEDSSDAAARDKAAIESVLRGWYRDFNAARATPAAPHEELREWVTPEMFAAARTRLDDLAERHQIARPAPSSQARLEILDVEQHSEDRYTAETCELSDGLLIDERTGSVIDSTVGIYSGTWAVQRAGTGRWVISSSAGRKVGDSAGPQWEDRCR
jgi:hypothetical protein